MWGVLERHVTMGATARLPRLAPACLLLLAPLSGSRDGDGRTLVEMAGASPRGVPALSLA